MIRISFKPSFIHQAQKLEKELFDELLEKIEALKNPENHLQLKVHKLHGRLTGCYGFSISYNIRVIFQYESKQEAVLLAIGDHDIYKN